MAIPCCGDCCEHACLFIFCCNKAHGVKKNDEIKAADDEERKNKIKKEESEKTKANVI